MITQETIQRIMDTAHIEEVIGEFVSLKKRGANHIGCCPFHNEKTPSFYVSPAKGIYKCFGCGESGNVVGFLMKHEHYTYPEALRWLADKYHIEIEEEKMSEEQIERNNERDALFHVSEFAQKYFASLLYDDEMGRAIGLAYFHSRGLSDKVIKDFGLGYCLDEWSAFTDYARKNGYSDNVLEKTGLTIFKDADDGDTANAKRRKCYDRFRGRVMFPIYSVSGRVLGFSGRVLSKEKQAAKYVNSPDSEIYNKSNILYGLYQAKNSISRQDKCYLVEGNIDVISMHQSGVENTVASCGTSLTVEQVRLMRRYTKNVTVLYDGDSAGIKAAMRAVNMLFEEGMHVRVVLFPNGEDPDSYAQKYGSSQLQQYLADNETNFIIFKTNVLVNEIKGDPIRKAEVLKEIVKTIALVPDLMERTEYVTLCASLLHTPEQTLQTELAKELNLKLMRDNAVQQEKRRASSVDKDIQEPAAAGGEVAAPVADTPVAEQPVQPQPPASEMQIDMTTVNPAEFQERKIISLLLNSGNELITVSEPAQEEGHHDTPMQSVYTVAQIVVGDLLNDQLSFDNPLYQTIFNDYVRMLDEGQTQIDMQHFVTHPDEAVRSLAVGMMMDDYHVSSNWASKNIYVPTPDKRLKEDLRESLLSFRMKKLERKINDIDLQFRYASEEDRMLLLAQKVEYIKLRGDIGKELNRVVI